MVGAGFLLGMTINGWRWEVKLSAEQASHERTRSEHAAQLQLLTDSALQAERDARQREQAALSAVAQIDQVYREDLANAQSEIETARAAVAAGERRLRLNASCPAPTTGNSMPGSAPSAGLGDDPGPRLADTVEQDYFTLTGRLETMELQLTACQAYAAEVSK